MTVSVSVSRSIEDAVQPGRLGNPTSDVGTDPRSDPRMIATLAKFGIHAAGPAPAVTAADLMEDRLNYAAELEKGFDAVFEALTLEAAPVSGVVRSVEKITGVDGNEITLFLHRPERSETRLPGVLHIHGGAMTISATAGPIFSYWRDRLAATGMVAIGVEFRNAGGELGPHPFPAGLNDCSSALQWVHDNREALGISHLVVAGESGGANLALALALKAKQEGRVEQIDGVHAISPYISGAYDWPEQDKLDRLPSLVENDAYLIGCAMLSILKSLYDPAAENDNNPLAWPLRASDDEVTGLPPHFVVLGEVDPLRDEGRAYVQKLRKAGVRTAGHIDLGLCHVGGWLFPGTLPEIYATTVESVHQFAVTLGA